MVHPVYSDVYRTHCNWSLVLNQTFYMTLSKDLDPPHLLAKKEVTGYLGSKEAFIILDLGQMCFFFVKTSFLTDLRNLTGVVVASKKGSVNLLSGYQLGAFFRRKFGKMIDPKISRKNSLQILRHFLFFPGMFGHSIDIKGDHIIVGSPHLYLGYFRCVGSVIIYKYADGQWDKGVILCRFLFDYILSLS